MLINSPFTTFIHLSLYSSILQITEVGTMNIFMLWINKNGGQFHNSNPKHQFHPKRIHSRLSIILHCSKYTCCVILYLGDLKRAEVFVVSFVS